MGVCVQAERLDLCAGASLDVCGPAVHLDHRRPTPAHAALVVDHDGAADDGAGGRADRRYDRRDLAPFPVCDGLVELRGRLLLHAAAAAVHRAVVDAAEEHTRGVWDMNIENCEWQIPFETLHSAIYNLQ